MTEPTKCNACDTDPCGYDPETCLCRICSGNRASLAAIKMVKDLLDKHFGSERND